jgi:uncharacterized protein
VAYHAGEVAAQRMAGEAAIGARSGHGVRTEVPPVAAEFLRAQPMLVLGAAEAAGAVWATVLAGEPGFLQVPDPGTVDVLAAPGPADPLAAVLAAPVPVGALAIEPATRRRVRLNGAAAPRPGGLRITLDQVISNCPKYIQARTWTPLPPAPATWPAARSDRLTGRQADLLRSTDTFFVATRHPGHGVDASHRGGNPGFVQVLDGRRLRWPDYTGNSMFLSLGNLLVDDRAGLLVPDWATGDLLHLTGTASIDWDPAHAAALPGARRLVDFTVEAVVEVPAGLPLRWTAPDYSRFNPAVTLVR